MSKRTKLIQKQIDEGTYKCPAVKIVEKLLKKNPKLSDTVCKEKKTWKTSTKLSLA